MFAPRWRWSLSLLVVLGALGVAPLAPAETGIAERISFRRTDYISKATARIADANRAFKHGEVLRAAEGYRQAIEDIPRAPMTIDLRNEAIFRFSVCVAAVVELPESQCSDGLKLALIDYLASLVEKQAASL